MKYKTRLNIVLVEPEIPNNTGNIGRTCVSVEAKLHLIGPLGFEISDKQLKRSGLDYWPHLDWAQYTDFDTWLSQLKSSERVFFFTTKTKKSLYSHRFREGDYLVFGKETKGLSESLLKKFPDQCLNIPMFGPVRSLNLANSVAISLYEGVRQLSICS